MNLKEALLENQSTLRLLLEKYKYLATAGPLRVLLCDADNPILLKYSEQIGRPLIVWTSSTLEEISTSLLDGLEVEINRPCSWDPRLVVSRTKIPLRDFLARDFCAAKDGKHYTPTQIIKATANKLGFAHFDENRQKYLKDSLEWKWNLGDSTSSKVDKSLVDRHMADIALWAVNAIDYLTQSELSFTIFLALDDINEASGEATFFCFQTGGIIKILIKETEIIVKLKSREISLRKESRSFLCIRGSNHQIEIYSNLLDAPISVTYDNIVTFNSFSNDRTFENTKGDAFIYSRLLSDSEILQLTDEDMRDKLRVQLRKAL